ncbi:unnamed protein product [Adineta ricciae]|uniref:Uncharacterized protein n=1 Tax=Adineta ricciae TaxID=249248 RepID=A0A814D5U7_ADIRI|nr:unnamed protein product [Adineta ricciae]CAF0953787.1 unnamed protein product [Adineta ricciae]
MANDGQTSRVPITTKTAISRQYQITTDGRIFEHSQGNDSHNHETSNLENTSRSKLPSLPSKSHISPFASESMQLLKSRKNIKDTLTKSSSFRIERQSTNVVSKRRLPTLHSNPPDPEQKLQSEYQRRQIYALNCLMRQLEQQKFREYFKLDENFGLNSPEIIPDNEDAQPST